MVTIKLQLEFLVSVIFKPVNNMWLQLELLVFLALFVLSFNDVESRSAGLESVKPISRSIREAHRGNGKHKGHPPPKRPACPNRKKCPKRPNHKKPHPKRRPPPRKPLPNQQVTVKVQTDTKSDVVNSNNAQYHTIINHFHHWVPLPFSNITQPNSTITPQPTTIIQHLTRPEGQELTTPQTSPASNCSDVTNRGPCTGSANQQNTSINIHLNVAPPVFYNHNDFPPPVAADNPDNRKNASNTQNGTEPSSTKSEQQTTTEKSTTTTTKIVQTSLKPNIEPLGESTKTTVTKLATTTVKPLKVPETNGQKPDNEDEQLDTSLIGSTPGTGRKLPTKSPTTTTSVANGKDDGAYVQNDPDVLGPLIDIRYQQ